MSRCLPTALSTAANGTAASAPTMPAICEPAAMARMTASGWTLTALPSRKRLEDVRLELLHADDDREHDQGDAGAMRDEREHDRHGAGEQGTDDGDEGEEEDEHADGEREGHLEDRCTERRCRRRRRSATIDRRADEGGQLVPGDPAGRGDAAARPRGKSRTTQAQMRGPS